MTLAVAVSQVFAYLDDHRRLAAHMSRRSWYMLGSRMEIETDSGEGQRVGSHIFLKGAVLGVALVVDEVVEIYEPNKRKVWRTVGEPRLLVIGAYRMGFEVLPANEGAQLRVFINFRWPRSPFGKVLGFVFGGGYARWCVRMMLVDAERHFRTMSAI